LARNALFESAGFVTIRVEFRMEGNGSLRGCIKSQGGVMKQREPKNKKQPTRHDYALALKTIRARFQTIESQSDTIRRQNQFMVMIWMDQPPAKRGNSQDKALEGSPSRWIN
jgi:hypothetical protein